MSPNMKNLLYWRVESRFGQQFKKRKYRNVRPHSLPAESHSFVGMARETVAGAGTLLDLCVSSQVSACERACFLELGPSLSLCLFP